jgi:hypothetical protein
VLCDQLQPRIILQEEQISRNNPNATRGRGFNKINYFRECHSFEQCVIWDFSDANLRYLQEIGVGDSVMVLPMMIQHRLSFDTANLPTLPSRRYDVAFFGILTPRRVNFYVPDNHTDWKFGKTANIGELVESYSNAKICLVLHAYHPLSSIELHRLSESVLSGCVPVMESWHDSYLFDNYTTCGGVVTANYTSLLLGEKVIQTTLEQIHRGEWDTKESLEWWRRGIQWSTFLVRVFEI